MAQRSIFSEAFDAADGSGDRPRIGVAAEASPAGRRSVLAILYPSA